MKQVISASRRTDLPAERPDWLAESLRRGRASFIGPRGGLRTVDLRPAAVHTLVLWSKDFSRLIADEAGLRTALGRYDQLYFLATVTGLGGTPIEPGAPPADKVLAQLPGLIAVAGRSKRVSLRFDPVVYWSEDGRLRSNLDAFPAVADAASRLGIEDIRISFAQWYKKSARRAKTRGFDFLDPSAEAKRSAAVGLSETAASRGLTLFSCSQDFLAGIAGIRPSSCIDGRLLAELHPAGERASTAKDRSQRAECRCTESVDIGSYGRACRHGCIYCYANPQ